MNINSLEQEIQENRESKHTRASSALHLMPFGMPFESSSGCGPQLSSAITKPATALDPPNLELTIAAPRTLDQNRTSTSSLQIGPIRVT